MNSLYNVSHRNKRTLWACVTLTALFGLSACGGGNTPSNSTTPLSAPSKVTLTLKNHNQIDVAWDGVANAESYKVYASPKSITTLATPDLANYNTITGSRIQSINKGTTNASLTGLDYATTYYVIVQSVGNGSSTASNTYAKGQEKSVKTGEAGPKNLTIKQEGATKLTFTWQAVAKASAYNLYTAKGDLAGKTLAQIHALASSADANIKVTKTPVASTKLTHTLEGLSIGDKRYGVVTAVVNNTESAPSAVVNKTIARFEKLANYEGKCVIDHKNNRMWEVKQDDTGLHGKHHTYTWYQDKGGKQNGGTCYNKSSTTASGNQCDTTGFVNSVNTEQWCGFADWRMPTRKELKSLEGTSKSSPKIDTDFFPNTQSAIYWSSSTYMFNYNSAWGVNFIYGNEFRDSKFNSHRTRLVRDR